MKISHEISLENFQAINRHAAKGVGRNVRSIQDDRWLRSTGPTSYQSVYDPSVGRLATSWIELRPGLVLLYGEARPRRPIVFPIRASGPLAGVFVGSHLTSHRPGQFTSDGKSGDTSRRPHFPEPRVVLISLVQDEQCQFHLAEGVPAYFFGVLGRDDALDREFAVVRRLARFDKGTADNAARARTGVKGDACTAILQMLRNPFQGDVRDAYVCGKALEILSMVLHSVESPGTEARSERKKKPVEFICNEIARMPPDDLVLADFATYLEVSERTLSRQFKAETGLTFSAYQRKKRMELAAQLLATGAASTTKIAQQVGYESITAFFRAFREQFNTTPDEYRRIQLY